MLCNNNVTRAGLKRTVVRRYLSDAATRSAGQALFAGDYGVGRSGRDGGHRGRGGSCGTQHGFRHKSSDGRYDGQYRRKDNVVAGTYGCVSNNSHQSNTLPQWKHQELEGGCVRCNKFEDRYEERKTRVLLVSPQVQTKRVTFKPEVSRNHIELLNCEVIGLTIECEIGFKDYGYLM